VSFRSEEIEAVIAQWNDRLRSVFPQAVAVLLKGSLVSGTAGPYSDIDLDVLQAGREMEAYPAWFEQARDGRLRHVSVAVQNVDAWLAEEAEPRTWAYGLPVHEATRLLWAATPTLRDILDRPHRAHPPADPEIEDAVESLGKMRNALERGDDLGMRHAAQALAGHVPSILRPLNPDATACSPRSALDIVLAFTATPASYRDDMHTCLGLPSEFVPGDAVFAAGAHMLTGTIVLAGDRQREIVPLVEPTLAAALRDGTLARYVRQIAERS
jgi:hypothetical protein